MSSSDSPFINHNFISNQLNSDNDSLASNMYRKLKKNLDTSLFSDDKKVKKSSKKGSKKSSKKGSKGAKRHSKRHSKGDSKELKRHSKRHSKRDLKNQSKSHSKKYALKHIVTTELEGGRKKGSKKSKVSKVSSEELDVKHKKGSKKSKKSKGSKRSVSGSKRTLPEKLIEFQKIIAYMAKVIGHRTVQLGKVAKMVRDEVMKSNPTASPQEITKKSMKLFDDNLAKYKSEYEKILAAKKASKK